MTRRLPARLSALVITLLVTLLLGLTSAQAQEAPAATIDPLPFKSHAEEVRFQKLTKQMRCLVCQDESLAASNAELAQQMRHIVFEQMQKGWTNQQIKDYFVARYSDYVLYKPPVKPSTWLLWFGPIIVLLLGAGAVIITVRRRRHGPPPSIPASDDDEW